MESDPKSAILFHVQLHPNDSFPGEENILFSLQGHTKTGTRRGAESRQFFSGRAAFSWQYSGATLVFGSVMKDWCTFVWILRGRSISVLWFPVRIRITLCKCPLYCCYCCLVTKSCLTLVTPWAVARPPGSSVREIFQARILERVAVSSSRVSSWPKDQTWISCNGRQILYHWDIKEELSPHTQHSFVNQVKCNKWVTVAAVQSRVPYLSTLEDAVCNWHNGTHIKI